MISLLIGGACIGHGPAWDMKETKQPNEDDWLHKRKDYSRHLQQKMRRQTVTNQTVVTKNKSLQNNQASESTHHLSKKQKNREQRQLGNFKKPMEDYHGNCINQPEQELIQTRWTQDKIALKNCILKTLTMSHLNWTEEDRMNTLFTTTEIFKNQRNNGHQSS